MSRTTEDIFATDDAYNMCVEAGVDPKEEISKFVFEDYAGVLIQRMEDGHITKEQALSLLGNLDDYGLNKQFLQSCHWVEIYDNYISFQEHQLALL